MQQTDKQQSAVGVLKIDEKWSIEYAVGDNDRPLNWLRYGAYHRSFDDSNCVVALFYAALDNIASPDKQQSAVVTLAKTLYSAWAGNHPEIHCNRMPAWDEIDAGTQNQWIAAARAALATKDNDHD